MILKNVALYYNINIFVDLYGEKSHWVKCELKCHWPQELRFGIWEGVKVWDVKGQIDRLIMNK
jgi:hypothetical protein